jgi:hypothetical protein
MTTIQIQLPDELAQNAQAAGLLTSDAMAARKYVPHEQSVASAMPADRAPGSRYQRRRSSAVVERHATPPAKSSHRRCDALALQQSHAHR